MSNSNKNTKSAEMKDRLRIALEMNDKKPIDLVNALGIPKSAISQYLSGKSKKMDSDRFYSICAYLNVSEGWLMGFDVPIERPVDKKTEEEEKDIIADAMDRMEKDKELFATVERLMYDKEFFEVVKLLGNLKKEKLNAVKELLQSSS